MTWVAQSLSGVEYGHMFEYGHTSREVDLLA